MLSISIEIEFENYKGLEGGEPQPLQASGSKLFDALVEWWVETIAGPYEKLSIDERLPPITIPWKYLGEDGSFQVAFDIALLENLLEIYTVYGWKALEAIERILGNFSYGSRRTKGFFRTTRNVVAIMIALELVELEEQVMIYAEQKWSESRKKLMSYLQAFDVLQLKSKNVSLKDKNMSKELFQLCRNYAVEANKARSLQGDINERNRKNPPKSRSDRPGEWVWFEVYAAPQRDALNKMDEYLKQIAAKFPPAILVLGELPDLILGAKSSNQKIIAQHEFESRIFSRLEFLVDALRTLEDSIKEKGATFQVAEYLKPMLSEQRDFSGITKLDLPLGGFEQEVINLAFVGSKVFSAEHGPVGEIKVQRLLADLDLVSDFYNDPHGVEPGTWRQIVLSQYRDRLDEIVESKKKDTKKWGEYWGYFAKFTALLTLVALMAIFPFGDVAVGSNLALLFTLCGTSSAILGVLTMLNNLFDTLEKSKQLDAAARDKFFRLAQTDPATILEIGEILSQNKALREELLTGSFENILTLGSAHKLKAIAVALNFQALFQDVETLFAPISTDGS